MSKIKSIKDLEKALGDMSRLSITNKDKFAKVNLGDLKEGIKKYVKNKVEIHYCNRTYNHLKEFQEDLNSGA